MIGLASSWDQLPLIATTPYVCVLINWDIVPIMAQWLIDYTGRLWRTAKSRRKH